MANLLTTLREKTLIRTRFRRATESLREYWIPLLTGRKTRTELKEEFQLAYWQRRFQEDGGRFKNDFYRQKYLSAGNIPDEEFFRGRIVMDVGCGPRGSLEWLTTARLRIGLDPLARHYGPFGIFKLHTMAYLVGVAERMPLPDDSVDIIITVNALDHVEDLFASMKELRRVLRPGGWLFGSINLNHRPTQSEPWCITTALLEEQLFAGYATEYTEHKHQTDGEEQLWFRVRKPHR